MTETIWLPGRSLIRTSTAIDAEIDGEAILLSVEQSSVFGLGPVGTRIWQLVDRGIRVDDLCTTLTREFDVTPETCLEQVRAFLDELLSEGLVEVIAE